MFDSNEGRMREILMKERKRRGMKTIFLIIYLFGSKEGREEILIKNMFGS